MQNNNPTSAYFSCDRSEMLAFIKHPPSNVLELGCGEGVFGATLKKLFGCRVVGLEASAKAAAKAALVLDTVHVVNIEAFDFERLSETFDLVIANDVLEHLINPWNLLSCIRSIIKQDGCFVASIPNMRCYKVLLGLLFKGEWAYCDAGILDRSHLRFFTQKSMRQLFIDSGYTVESCCNVKPPKIKHFGKWLQYQLYPDLLTVQYGIIARPFPEVQHESPKLSR